MSIHTSMFGNHDKEYRNSSRVSRMTLRSFYFKKNDINILVLSKKSSKFAT